LSDEKQFDNEEVNAIDKIDEQLASSEGADEETVDILEEEAEATPEQEAVTASAAETPEGYQEGDGLAPFAASAHDPGLEDDLGEGEEAPAAPEPIVYRELSGSELQAAVEATLFMHQKPITVNRIRELVNPEIPEDDYRTAISNLQTVFFDEARGIELVEVANGWQFRTKAENKDIIRRMYQIAPMKLTNAMLEVLAIVAYNQPLTREGVDKIRGVDSSHLLRVLLDKKMLRIAGKSDTVGNPMIYATTKEFLELFGLRDLSALPTLRELEEMLPKNEVGSISEEEALGQEMEGIVAASKPVDFADLELEGWDPEEEKRELLGADEGGVKGPSWKERIRARREQITQQVAAGLDPAAEVAPAAEASTAEATEESQRRETQQQVENEPQTNPEHQSHPPGENGDGSETRDDSTP
jgi:segregation and condensation protein B